MQNYKDIIIFITSYNRLNYLKKLISYLEKHKYTNIHIIDNCSTYPPLLDYYKTLPYTVHHMDKNYGHKALFVAPQFRKIISKNYFVLTDPDILPIEDCPDDFLAVFMDILQTYPQLTKVGFSLKIDDIPDEYQLKEQVLLWESYSYLSEQSHSKYLLYNADIDTTFALYRPVRFLLDLKRNFYKAIRTGYPYVARHLPWYVDLDKPTEEDLFYNTTDKDYGNWNRVLNTQEILYKITRDDVVTTKIKLFKYFPLLTIRYIKNKELQLHLFKFFPLFQKITTRSGYYRIKFCKFLKFEFKRQKDYNERQE